VFPVIRRGRADPVTRTANRSELPSRSPCNPADEMKVARDAMDKTERRQGPVNIKQSK